MHQSKLKNALPLLLALLLCLFSSTAALAADAVYTVETNQYARIELKITDEAGRTVAPGQAIDGISYIVKSKPEGAKVSASTHSFGDLEQTGRFTMAFTCDKPGTVEIQTFVRMQDKAKYYQGLHTIQVKEPQQEGSTIAIMSIGSRQIVVNDTVLQADVAPVIQNNRTYVPIRVLSQIFGATCQYDSASQLITITKGSTVIGMTIGADTYTLNGQTHPLDAPAYIDSSRTMVPIRFVTDGLGIVLKTIQHENGTVKDLMFQL